MPDLSTINGRTLAPNLTGINNLLLQTFGTKQSRARDAAAAKQQEELQRLIGIISGDTSEMPDLPPGTIDESGAIDPQSFEIRNLPAVSAKRREAALVRLSALNPQAANSIRQTLERGDKIEAQKIADETAKGTRLAALVKRQPDLASKQRIITQAAQEAASRGENIDRFVELSNMGEERLDLELQKMLIQGTDLKTLTDSALNPAGEEGFTLSQGQTRFGPDGQPIASVDPKPEAETSLVKNMRAAGIDPASREGKALIRKNLTKSGVNVNVGGQLPFKVPPGFMLLDKNNPTAGVTPIPGGPKDSLSAESAAKVQMLKTAEKAFTKDVRDLVFDKDGNLDRVNLFAADNNVPFTDGRKLRTNMEFGIQAITRAETGAAMPPQEVENTRQRFMPKVGDTKEIAETKLQMYKDFIDGSIKLIDPTGSLDDNGQPAPAVSDEAFQKELENRTGEKTIGRFKIKVK